MALADVLSKITYNGYSAAEMATFVAAITKIYNGSATARATLDKVGDGTSPLTFNNIAGAANATAGVVNLDPAFPATVSMIDETGTVVEVSLERVLIHEVIHAVDGLIDEPDLGSLADIIKLADYRGSTVTKTNTIMSELGDATGRVTYQAVDLKTNLPLGTEFTDGNSIDAAFIARGSAIDMATSGRTTNDLLIGDGTNDNFKAAAGNDYMWGKGGNDALDGGAGTDVAMYSGKCSEYDITKNADGTITVVHARGTMADGTDTLTAVEFAQFTDFKLDLSGDPLSCAGQDIAFVIDTTGSMFDDIDAVKAQAATIINAIFDSSSGPVNSRVAVVGYNDPATETILNFTDHADVEKRKVAAIAAINSISVGGGGDFPEAVFGGLLRALNGGAGTWREEATARRIILFGDAPPKDFELAAQVFQLAADLNVVLSAADKSEVLVEDVSVDSEVVVNGLVKTTINVKVSSGESSHTVVPVEIYTVQIGADSSTSDAFKDISGKTGGTTFEAADASEVVGELLKIVSTQINFNGTDGNDLIEANVNSNVIDAGAGNDVIHAYTGADTITTGTGSDKVVGTLNDFAGDTITDLTTLDSLVFEGVTFGLSNMSFATGSTIISIDADADGTVDSTFTLEGVFTGGTFMAVNHSGNTVVSFETFLPTLTEKSAVDTASINGVNNQDFLTGDGTKGFRVTLNDTLSGSSNDNPLGVYEIDADGNIVDVRLLAPKTKDSSEVIDITGVEDGNRLGFFIIRNNDDNPIDVALSTSVSLSFVNSTGDPGNISDGSGLMLLVNGVAIDQFIFHSFNRSLNSDDTVHTLSGVNSDGTSITMGFEDKVSGGDMDYQDVVFSVDTFDFV